MAEPSILDPYPFQNFPQFNPSDLDFPFPDTFDSQIPNLDDIDLDFSIDDLDLDFNEIGSSPNSNSNLTTDSNSNPNSNPGSPESGNSSVGIKRKIDDSGGEDTIGNPNPRPNPNRDNEIRRTDEDEEKRTARMMRNRESALLSRQRKKQYVEELEQKVKVLNSTIADLNGKVAFYMAENVRLHQQLNGNVGNANATPCAVYPPPTYHYPWIPYAMRPSGLPGPYIPIPRLKTQHTSKKSGDEKRESKRKKVASVSLFGLLFVLMLFGGVMNFGLGESRNKDNGRVLSVKGRSLNNTDDFGIFSGKMASDNWGANRMYQNGQGGRHNSSETLPALLYVPRNGKHVEINGNLILHSVLASERAMQQKFKRKENRSPRKEDTGLAIQGHISSALAISKGTMNVGKRCTTCDPSAEHPRALASDFHDAYRDNIKSTSADGPLQQWFLEGLAGPILSSGTCTEIFQFEVNPSGVIPVTSAVNASDKLPRGKIKSRRILYQPIPLNGTALNNTENFDSSKILNGNDSKPSMIVSVLADPRDAGDGDGDRMITPKLLSRIFVVVLLDSVKYVTYSCMLPLKSHAPLLVN